MGSGVIAFDREMNVLMINPYAKKIFGISGEIIGNKLLDYITDKEVLNELSQYNNYLCRWVRFDMGEKHYETISPKEIKDWIVIGDDASVSIDQEKIAQWVEKFLFEIQNSRKNKKIQVTYW